MCTATWLSIEGVDGGGYELFFSRDELRTRGRALPPSPGERRGVRYLAPTDADAGGTWIGANELGLSLGLLNGYVEGAPRAEPGRASRGLLVLDLVDGDSLEDVGRRLFERDLTPFPSFRLIALAPRAPPVAFRWDGRELHEECGLEAPVVSSSLDPVRAECARSKVYDCLVARGPTPEQLQAFHESHEPERGPFSVCMHRDEATTVSLCRVRVDAGLVRMSYRGGAPCERGSAVENVLERRRR